MSESELDTLARLALELPGARVVPTIDEKGNQVGTVWLPYGPGLEIPPLFQYEGSGPFDWTILVAVVDGRPQCIALECHGRPLTPEALHRFPLGRMVEEAALMSARPVDEIPRRKITWENIEEARRAQTRALKHFRSRRRIGGRVTDERLAEIARVYRENVATGKPSKAVAKRFNYSDSRARRLVAMARERDLLGPAERGRAGEYKQKGDDDG
jgi:hypothetical protein